MFYTVTALSALTEILLSAALWGSYRSIYIQPGGEAVQSPKCSTEIWQGKIEEV